METETVKSCCLARLNKMQQGIESTGLVVCQQLHAIVIGITTQLDSFDRDSRHIVKITGLRQATLKSKENKPQQPGVHSPVRHC